jgi:hypothetical protein
MDKPVTKPVVEAKTREIRSRAVATPAQIREAGLVLQNAMATYSTAVDAANDAVGAIQTAVAAFDFKGNDGALPTQADLKAQIVAFNALPNSIMAKPSLSVSGSIAAVNS